MKKLFMALAAALLLTAQVPAQTTMHRHDPKIVNATDSADNEAIVAYSDTTSATQDATAAYSGTDADDESDIVSSFDSVSDPFSLIAFLTGLSGAGAILISVLVVLLCLLTVLSPFIFVILIIYFVMRSRNKKYRIIEKAVESGQPIPQELLAKKSSGDSLMWGNGVRNAAIGIGVVLFGFVLDTGFFVGMGWILFFYGVGQIVVVRFPLGKRRDEKKQTHDDFRDDGTVEDIKD